MFLLLLFACITDDWKPETSRPVEPGAPRVGAAEGFLQLPVGTPLSGYSVRCSCLTGQSRQDDRRSAYTVGFVESTGVQTFPTIKVIWIENGDDHLVLTKTDSIYSYDGLVEALEVHLSEATGIDLDGRVVHTTNHSHASYGTFSDQITFYLGSDKFNRENFDRFVDQVGDVAMAAYDERQDAKIGLSWTADWDPEDRIYRDRRTENDDLVLPEPMPYSNGKDPWLGLMRFDTLADEPIAVMLNFGMHGIVLSEKSPLVATDASGGVEAVLQEWYDDEVVVMYTQGAGGDQSPAGTDDAFARVESIGERAAPILYEVWETTPTSAEPIALQTVSRHIPQHPSQIHVTRNGTVDWHYPPYKEGAVADGVVYEDDGSLSTFDEFNARFGMVFCGTGDLDFPVGKLNTDVWPYTNCMDVELISRLLLVFFDLSEDELPLPLPESLTAGTTASRIGPVRTLRDGVEDDTDLLMGFFPGEPTSLFTQHWRARVEAELGYEFPMMVGYSQDHEGYLMIPEDWMVAGYEPDIGLWGPLQSEHVLEGVMSYIDDHLSDDVHDDHDPLGLYGPTAYPDKPLPENAPDRTPDAGTWLTEAPEYFWMPMEMEIALSVPAEVPRVQGMVKIGWIGGDPAVDIPILHLERLDGSDWVPVTTHTGRPVTSAFHDFLVGHTPDPLYPFDVPQTHYRVGVWQAVSHVHDRAGLPLGTYRVRVSGAHWTGEESTWPWTSTPYELNTAPFEVVPATLDVLEDPAGLAVGLTAPSEGFRFLAEGGHSQSDNPIPLPAVVVVESPSGTVELTVDTAATAAGRSVLAVDLDPDWTQITVEDRYGNAGTLTR